MCNYFIQRLGRTCKLKTFKDDLCKCHYKMMTKCPICLESLDKIYVTACNHEFHEGCINQWLETRNNCPMCRHVLIDRPEPLRNLEAELRNSLIDLFEYIIAMRRILNRTTGNYALSLTDENDETRIYNNELEELRHIRDQFDTRNTNNEPNEEREE